MQEFRTEYNEFTDATETYYWDYITKTMTIRTRYDVTDVIENNKRRANASVDARFGNQMMHHVADIPNGVLVSWMKDGYDLLSNDPDMKRRCMRRLHDPEWRYLRTTTKKVL